MLPVKEVFVLRAQVGSILNIINILHNSKGKENVDVFKKKANLSDGAFLNMMRDLRLLKLADIKDNSIHLLIPTFDEEEKTIENLRSHIADRLARNRSINAILSNLKEKGRLTIGEVAQILRDQFPYISAVEKTWTLYARIFCKWLDIADLAVLNESDSTLIKFSEGNQVRERKLPPPRRRGGVNAPYVHFAPVVQVANRLITAITKKAPLDLSGLRRSTINKALSMLEELELIERVSKTIQVLPLCHEFANNTNVRVEIVKNKALKWPIFRKFIDILKSHGNEKLSHKQLAELLREEDDITWKQSTAEVNVKIMLDWARNLGMAPGKFKHTSRGQFKPSTDMSQSIWDNCS